MEIRRKFTKEQAEKEIQEYKIKILGESILDLLESEEVKDDVQEVQAGKYLITAVMGGLVEFDEENKCLVQKLKNPVASGEQKADCLYYRNNLTLGMMRDETTANDYALTINLMARITGRSKQIIEKVFGDDLKIMQEIASFFYA